MKLTKSQMEKLKEHSKEHGGLNSKHMRMMKKLMEDGMSFAKAHREAMKMEDKDKDPKSKSKPMKKKNKSKY